MKAYLLIFIAIVIFGTFASAQDNKNARVFKRFSVPKLDSTVSDSSARITTLNLNALIGKKDNSIPIPNAYSGNKMIYIMPVKKLSGVGLAPMPGTENIDKRENKRQSDSLRIKEKFKK